MILEECKEDERASGSDYVDGDDETSNGYTVSQFHIAWPVLANPLYSLKWPGSGLVIINNGQSISVWWKGIRLLTLLTLGNSISILLPPCPVVGHGSNNHKIRETPLEQATRSRCKMCVWALHRETTNLSPQEAKTQLQTIILFSTRIHWTKLARYFLFKQHNTLVPSKTCYMGPLPSPRCVELFVYDACQKTIQAKEFDVPPRQMSKRNQQGILWGEIRGVDKSI